MSARPRFHLRFTHSRTRISFLLLRQTTVFAMQLISVILFTLAAYTVTAYDAKYSSSKAVGPCILNRCPRGFQCANTECVPNASEIEELGPCVNSLCPKTYQCNDNTCIRPKPKVRADADSIGPCVNDQCPDDHICITSENKCYPMD